MIAIPRLNFPKMCNPEIPFSRLGLPTRLVVIWALQIDFIPRMQ